MSKYPSHRKWVHHTSAYHGKGGSRFRMPHFILYLLIVLLAAALFLLGAALYLQRYMVYTREGGTLVLPGAAEEEPAAPDSGPLTGLDVVEEVAQTALETSSPSPLRAVQISVEDLLAGNAAALLEQYGGNAVVLDMKPVSGVLCWTTRHTPEGGESPVSPDAPAVEAAVAALKAEGIYLIAQIHCFRDDALVKNASFTLPNSAEEGSVLPTGGSWLDPSLPILQVYISNLAKELSQLGFDELLISDWTCPEFQENDPLTAQERQSAAVDFGVLLAQALDRGDPGSEERPPVMLGVETGEITLLPEENWNAGTPFSALAGQADRIWCAVEDPSALAGQFSQEALQDGTLVLIGSQFQEDLPWRAQAVMARVQDTYE